MPFIAEPIVDWRRGFVPCPRTSLQCFASEQRESKPKHCRDVLGRKNKVQNLSLSLVYVLFYTLPKVIYSKYSKHWPYSVAHTTDCVSNKMLNCGLTISFTFQMYDLPNTFNCISVSLFRFSIWILEQFCTAQNGLFCPDT